VCGNFEAISGQKPPACAISEPLPHVDRVDDGIDDLTMVIASLDARDAFERPAVEVEFALAAEAAQYHAA